MFLFLTQRKKHFQVHIRPSFPMNPGNRASWVNIRVFVWKCRKLGKKKTKSNALKLKFPVEMALSWGNFPDGNFLQINFPDGFLHHDQLNQWWKALVSQKRFLVPWAHEPLKRRFRVKTRDVSQKKLGDVTKLLVKCWACRHDHDRD